jgi:hypothetical protein
MKPSLMLARPERAVWDVGLEREARSKAGEDG